MVVKFFYVYKMHLQVYGYIISSCMKKTKNYFFALYKANDSVLYKKMKYNLSIYLYKKNKETAGNELESLTLIA